MAQSLSSPCAKQDVLSFVPAPPPTTMLCIGYGDEVQEE